MFERYPCCRIFRLTFVCWLLFSFKLSTVIVDRNKGIEWRAENFTTLQCLEFFVQKTWSRASVIAGVGAIASVS